MTIHTLIFTQTSGMAWALARGMGPVFFRKKDHIILDGVIIFWVSDPLARHATPSEYQRDWKRYRWQQLPILPDLKMQHTQAVKHLLEWLKTIAFTSKGSVKRVILAPSPENSSYWRMQQALEIAERAGIMKGCEVWMANMEHISAETLRPQNLVPWNPGLRLDAEQCRVHGDWLMGMNLTRLLTIAYPDTYSTHCGRVVTAMLQVIAQGDCPVPSFTDCRFSNLQGHLVNQGHLPEAVILSVQWLYERSVITWPFGAHAPQFKRFVAQDYPSTLHHQIAAMIHGEIPPPVRTMKKSSVTLGALLAHLGAYPTPQGVVAIGSDRSRHKTIEKLSENNLIQIEASGISLTRQGLRNLEIVPPVMRDPRLILIWEKHIQEIEDGKLSSADFYREVRSFLVSSMEYIRSRSTPVSHMA